MGPLALPILVVVFDMSEWAWTAGLMPCGKIIEWGPGLCDRGQGGLGCIYPRLSHVVEFKACGCVYECP